MENANVEDIAVYHSPTFTSKAFLLQTFTFDLESTAVPSNNFFSFYAKLLHFVMLSSIQKSFPCFLTFIKINDFLDHTSSPVDGITLTESMHAR